MIGLAEKVTSKVRAKTMNQMTAEMTNTTIVYVMIEHLRSAKQIHVKLHYTEKSEQAYIDLVYSLLDIDCVLTSIDEDDYEDFPDLFGDEKLEVNLDEGLSKLTDALQSNRTK